MTNVWVPPMGVMMGSADIDFLTPAPIFSVLFNDIGNGACSVNPIISYGPLTSFSRASAAWTRLSNGLWTQVGVNVPRSYYGTKEGTPFAGRYDGHLNERASTNNCLWNRDLTNAVWTKSNVTVAKDYPGIDGVANSSSRIVATANNGTVIQINAAATQWCSVYLKRLIGTGTISITKDNGGSWTDITAALAAYGTEWSPIPFSIFGATSNFGIRLGTSGDSVAWDMAQIESAVTGSTTSPIETAGGAVTRATDSLYYGPTSTIFPDARNFTAGALITAPFEATFNTPVVLLSALDANNRISLQVQGSSFAARMIKRLGGLDTYASCTQINRYFTTGVPAYLFGLHTINVGMGALFDNYQADTFLNNGPTTPILGTFTEVGAGASINNSLSMTLRNLAVYTKPLDYYQLERITN